MKVICINDTTTNPTVIHAVEGNIYTVLGISDVYKDHYYIMELPLSTDGIKVSYSARGFAPISNIDEVELLKERQANYDKEVCT